MTLIIQSQTVMVVETLIKEIKLYMLIPVNMILIWLNINVEHINIMSLIHAYVPFSVIINALGQIVGVAGSIALLIYTRYKFLQDMRNKQLDYKIKMAQLKEIERRAGMTSVDPMNE